MPEDQFSVASVAVKLPPFTIKTPGVWFRRAEAKFRLSGITQSTTMADHTLSAMTESTAELIQAWLADQPDHLLYEDLKDYILKRFCLPVSERAQRVLRLADQPLGDNTARERWEEIQSLLNLPSKDGKTQRVSLEREIFLQSLPTEVRQNLPQAHEMTTENLIVTTEKLMDAHRASRQRTPAFQISDQNADVCAAAPRQQRRSRPVQTPPEGKDGELCYYHVRFGDDAKKCRPHCPRYSKNGVMGRQ